MLPSAFTDALGTLETSVLKNPDDELHQTDPAAISLLSSSLARLRLGHFFPARTLADSGVDHAHELLHSVPYHDVPEAWRRLYAWASLLKAACCRVLASEAEKESSDILGQSLETGYADSRNWLEQALTSLDMALVITGAPQCKELVMRAVEEVEAELRRLEEVRELANPKVPTNPQIETSRVRRLNDMEPSASSPRPKRARRSYHEVSEKESPSRSSTPNISRPIPRHEIAPDVFTFSAHIRSTNPLPMIICHAIDHWPAISKRPWSDLEYLKKTAGPARTVPIEIGDRYTDESWSQRMMSFGEFVDRFVSPSESVYRSGEPSPPIAYLAQHALFEQIPRLRDDIQIPDYCYMGERESIVTNAWFGPKGTVSPLHHDGERHNLLAQVAGKKYIRLYAPEETNNVYPFEENGLLNNTSQIDVESPNLSLYPNFASAAYQECILEPGEILYIPVSISETLIDALNLIRTIAEGNECRPIQLII